MHLIYQNARQDGCNEQAAADACRDLGLESRRSTGGLGGHDECGDDDHGGPGLLGQREAGNRGSRHEAARKHYEDHGWQVTPVHKIKNLGYDLECTRPDSDVRRVEVKGHPNER
jgi:hypothetical protein